MGTNLDRLQAAGIGVETPLRDPYRTIAEALSEEEVNALISVKRRFDEHTAVEAHGVNTEREGPPDEFFAFF